MNRYAKIVVMTLALAVTVVLGSLFLTDGVHMAPPAPQQARADVPYTFVYVEELNDRALIAMPVISPAQRAATFDRDSRRLFVELPDFAVPTGAFGLVLHEIRNNDILLSSSLVPVMDFLLTIRDRDLTIMATDPLRSDPPQDIVVDSRRLLRGDMHLTFLEGGKVRVERDGEVRLLEPDQHWLLTAGGNGEPRSRLLIWNGGLWSTSRLTTVGR